jgi:pimeloyl-ACP methyl ester carboxylesterase
LSTPPLRLPAATWASAWVAFGGSYPGSLATWLKLKYPSLLRGAVGSSAPVFAEYDYVQYAEVRRSYRRSVAWDDVRASKKNMFLKQKKLAFLLVVASQTPPTLLILHPACLLHLLRACSAPPPPPPTTGDGPLGDGPRAGLPPHRRLDRVR